MRAAVLRGGKIEVRDTEDPTPGPGEILVKTRACGICGTDIHFMDHPNADDDDETGLSQYDADADIVMGHEYTAEIVDYGPNTRREWKKGTRVTSIPVLIRETGARVIGQAAEAPGGFGEYFLLSEALTEVIDSPLPDELIAITDAIAVGWHYARAADIGRDEVPLVIGCGAIGLAVIASLKRMGVGPIVAADFLPSRRKTAAIMGADIVVDPKDISPFRAWRDIAHGSVEQSRDLFAQVNLRKCVVFECVGVAGVLNQIIKSCERNTRIFSAGGPPEGEHLHTMVAKRKGLNIQFGGGPQMHDWKAALDEVASGRMDVTPMTGRMINVAEMPQAIEDARDASSPPRIILNDWS